MKKTPRDKRTNLEKEIDSLITYLGGIKPEDPEYLIVSENIERLYKAKAHERQRNISPDTMALVAGNLLGIAMILSHEKLNIITTKALGFVIKGRA